MRHLVTTTTGIVGTIALAALAACSDPAAPERAIPDAARFANGPAPKVTICHAAGQAGTSKYVTITVSTNGENGHITEHGTPAAGHEQDFIWVEGMPACESFGGGQQNTWLVDKTYLGAFGMHPNGAMFLVSGPGSPVTVPLGATLWLEFRITATGPTPSSTATLTDLTALACASLPPGFLCQALAPYGDPTTAYLVNYTTSITGTYTTTFFIDVKNTGACNTGGTLTNTVVLTPTAGGGTFSDAASVAIVAPPCN